MNRYFHNAYLDVAVVIFLASNYESSIMKDNQLPKLKMKTKLDDSHQVNSYAYE